MIPRLHSAVLLTLALSLGVFIGASYRDAHPSRPWLANKLHASLTILDYEAPLFLYDSLHTVPYFMGQGLNRQIPHWWDSLHALFPRDTVIPLKITIRRTGR